MSLLTIEEPSKISKDNTCIGIDFGTTNSVSSVFINGEVKFISDENDKILIPTAISYKEEKKKFGNNISENEFLDTIYSIKRNFVNDPDDKLFKNYENMKISSVEVAKDFFSYLKNLCDSYLKSPIYDCVLTVPAYFDEKSRSEIMRSAFLAGLNVRRLINEPTAAAFAYGLETKKTGTFLVYDLGGGTFDISILKLSEGIFKVLGTSGDTMLGGDDLDKVFAEFILKENFNLEFSSIKDEDKKQILRLSKTYKEKFSQKESFSDIIKVNNKKKKIDIRLNDFNKSIELLIERTIKITKNLQNELNITDNSIDGIILVGGSTRCKLISQKLKNSFKSKLFDDFNPDLVVSKGAALHGYDILNGSNNLLLDVTPLSLGIETVGGLMEKVISRNTPIPAIKEQSFTTFENGQTSIKIKILQGERETSDNNRNLGEFILSGLDPKPAGIPRVKVRFSLDADGILLVSAIDESTGKKNNLVIKTGKDIDLKDMRRIVESSISNAEEDINQRMLIEIKVKAQKLINEIGFYNKDIEKLCDKKNIVNINKIITMLKVELNNNNKSRIEALYEQLNKETEKFAQKKIESEFTSLVGKDAKQLEE